PAAEGDGFDLYLAHLTGADLTLAAGATPDPVAAGGRLTYRVDVANQGPDGADDAALAFVVPAGATLEGTPPTTGTCAPSPGPDSDALVTCPFGDLAKGQGSRVEITIATPSGATTLEAQALVSSPTLDPDARNSATVTTAVQPGA